MIVEHVVVSQLRLPLKKPFRVATCVIADFQPIVAEVRDRDGRVGWGEAIIIDGYAKETAVAGWKFCRDIAAELPGLDTETAKAMLRKHVLRQSHVVSVLTAAIESLERNSSLIVTAPTSVPLLESVQDMTRDTIPDEVERLLSQGFRTLKVKVGFEADADLKRVALIQRICAGHASLRLDANQGFNRADAVRFAASLDPAGIELLEQPCNQADWSANGAVAAVSSVPIMLDESIYDVSDIERAAAIPGISYVKLKLKKFGGIDALSEGLDRVRAAGLTPVLGDGVATEICCWMEACVASAQISNAGEMNGFLKLRDTIVEEPIQVVDGAVQLMGYWPRMDRAKVRLYELATECFSMSSVKNAVQVG